MDPDIIQYIKPIIVALIILGGIGYRDHLNQTK
jgi:hypothetical protein